MLGKELATEGPGETLASAVRAATLLGAKGLAGWWLRSSDDCGSVKFRMRPAVVMHVSICSRGCLRSSACPVLSVSVMFLSPHPHVGLPALPPVPAPVSWEPPRPSRPGPRSLAQMLIGGLLSPLHSASHPLSSLCSSSLCGIVSSFSFCLLVP